MTLPSGLVLLDTNVLVHLVRGNDFGRTVDQQYGLRTRLDRPLLSVVTVGEIFSLARRWKWGSDKEGRMLDLVRELVVVDIHREEILRSYAMIDQYLVEKGRPIGDNDTWIAATAAATSATLLTTDQDFDALEGTFIKRVYIPPPMKSAP